MNELQRGILDLIKASLTGERITLPEDFDWMTAGKLGQAHQILAMLYYGALNAQVAIPEDVRSRLETATMQGVFVDQNQLYELDCIREQFVQNGVDFLPLKGTVLKSMYPHSDMRRMGDADVLIRTEQYGVIQPIMEQLGYTPVLESDHELVWEKKGLLYLELHKRLIPSYNKDYYAYFGDGWNLAHKTETTEYRMGDADNFVYLFTHYAKHYRDAGIGIRHLVDLYVYRQNKPQLDVAYVEQELEKLQLLTFYRHSMDTLAVWFDGAADTTMTDFITQRIFGSGSYGTQENSRLAEGLKTSKEGGKEQVKTKKMLSFAFPPISIMVDVYPVLKRHPWLLPLMWIHRGIKALLFKRDSIAVLHQRADVMTAENITAYQDELNYVGLDFNFGE